MAAAQALSDMKNRWLLNIGLALLIGVLVLVNVYQPGKKQEPDGTPLTLLAPSEIQQIRLLRPQQTPVVLEKIGAAWRMSAPRTARASEVRVNELVQLANSRVKVRFPAAPTDLAKYGLDKPLVTVFLNDQEIRFGGMHPLESQLYVWHDNQVALVAAATLRAASSPVNDFLNTSVLEEKTKPMAFRLPGFSLKQNEQGAWVRSPELKELGSDAVNRFVDEWRFARALSVAPYSGKPVKERITLDLAEGDKTKILELGVLAREPEFIVYRKDEGLQYHFPADIGARLMQIKAE